MSHQVHLRPLVDLDSSRRWRTSPGRLCERVFKWQEVWIKGSLRIFKVKWDKMYCDYRKFIQVLSSVSSCWLAPSDAACEKEEDDKSIKWNPAGGRGQRRTSSVGPIIEWRDELWFCGRDEMLNWTSREVGGLGPISSWILPNLQTTTALQTSLRFQTTVQLDLTRVDLNEQNTISFSVIVWTKENTYLSMSPENVRRFWWFLCWVSGHGFISKPNGS